MGNPDLFKLGAAFLTGALVSFLVCRRKPKPERRLILMATIKVDATKPIIFKNPVVRFARDKEGSPIPLDTPLPVQNYAITVQNSVGNFGTVVVDQGDGTWKYDPGDEIDEQASGELLQTGSVTIDGETRNVESVLGVELEPGEAVAFGAIEPELEILDN